MSSEPFLKHACDWLADSGERGLWPGNRADSVDDFVGLRIDEHLKELFAALRVVRQRSVGEAKPSGIVQAADAENAATVQGPEPQVADQNGHDRARHGRSICWKRFDPAYVELLPGNQGGPRALERGFAVPNRDG